MNASPSLPRDDLAEVVHVVVILQAAILATIAIESAVFIAFAGPPAMPAATLTAATALVAFGVAAGLGHRSGWARRATLIGEGGLLLTGVVDLGLGALGGSGMPLVAALTRIILPIVIVVVLRRPSVRLAFAGRPVVERASSEAGI